MGENDMSWKILFVILFLSCIFSLNNASALSLTVHVPEKYTDVSPGDRFYFEIEVKYPENPKRKDLRMEYEIRTPDDELIAQSKALKAVETQASFIDFIIIPESASTGLYLINVKVKDYELLSEEVGSSFQVVRKRSDDIKIYFFVLLGAVLFIGGLITVQLTRRKK